MCHTEVAPGQSTPTADREEVTLALSTGEQMPALAVGSGEDPAVLLIGDLFGPSPFYEHLAALLADAGLYALLPDFFFRQGALSEQSRPAAFARRGQVDEVRSLEDLREAVAWLRRRSGAPAVGVVGFCMGGTFALDLASTETDLVTVAYYGFPVNPENVVTPPPDPISVVGALRGPVLAFWGEDDETVGIDNVHRYIEQAGEAGAPLDHQILPGLAHGFLATADLGDAADPGGATWQRSVAHLREHLAGAGPRSR